jgi:SAM-dependent methyltransferase
MRPKELFKALASPTYLMSFWRYRKLAREGAQPLPALRRIRPITNEATAQTGFDAHYIYHTGWAARVLAETRPEQHVDIGSSLYFVSIASAIVPITHYDYRPPALAMPGVAVGAADLLALPFAEGAFPSLSCMHVIEHVGLGRYGDRLDPLGDRKAASELARVLAPGGQLLFATPVGRPTIAFNAHRIYGHGDVLQLFSSLRLKSFALITDKRDGNLFLPDANPERVAQQRYGCGCYVFEKPASG